MATQKFEVYGTLTTVPQRGIDAFLLSNKVVTLTYEQLVGAVCLDQHKKGLKEDKCIGYRITENEINFYFEK